MMIFFVKSQEASPEPPKGERFEGFKGLRGLSRLGGGFKSLRV